MSVAGPEIEERHELIERHPPVGREPARERHALHELHRQPEQPIVLGAERVDVRGIGVIEPRRELRLAAVIRITPLARSDGLADDAAARASPSASPQLPAARLAPRTAFQSLCRCRRLMLDLLDFIHEELEQQL